MGRKLGVFGGTFDPIHVGHLIHAEHCRDQLDLDAVLFVPASLPPHKPADSITDGRHRLDMIRLAIAGNVGFEARDLELQRGGVSFTVQTLDSIHEQHVDAELYFLMGADSLADFHNWRQPERIVELARLAIARRSVSESDDRANRAWPAVPAALPDDRIVEISSPMVAISSSQIRKRVAEGRSIRYLVPAAVEAYIHAHGLYRAAVLSKRE